MSRRPRVLEFVRADAERCALPPTHEPDLLDGDLVIARFTGTGLPITWRLIGAQQQLYYRMPIELDGRHIDNSFEWFAEILDVCRRSMIRFTLRMSLTDVSVVTACRGMETLWSHLEIEYTLYAVQHMIVRVIYDTDFSSRYAVEIGSSLNELPLIDDYERLLESSTSIFVGMWRVSESLRINNLPTGWRIRDGRTDIQPVMPADDAPRSRQSVVIFSGPASSAADAIERIRIVAGTNGVTTMRSRINTQWAIETSAMGGRVCNIVESPDRLIGYLWQSQHAAITELALIFLAGGLPPYVVLEIVDWLPTMKHRKHGVKIALITGLQASINRLRLSHESRARE